MNDYENILTIIEYNPSKKEVLIYANTDGLNDLRGDISYLKGKYDHSEYVGLCYEQENKINKDNYLVEFFQFNHLKTPTGWSHLLWFEGWETGVICCLDNVGVDILLNKFAELENLNVLEVTLKGALELSPPDTPLDKNFELVECVRIIKLENKS